MIAPIAMKIDPSPAVKSIAPVIRFKKEAKLSLVTVMARNIKKPPVRKNASDLNSSRVMVVRFNKR